MITMIKRHACVISVLFSIMLSYHARSELQASNERACLQGSSEASSNCGSTAVPTPGSDSSDIQSSTSSSLLQNGRKNVSDVWSPAPSGRQCRARGSCRRLPAACLSCQFNTSCVYGSNVTVLCRPGPDVQCSGVRQFERTMTCAYCYQTPAWQHHCSLCNVMARGRKYYRANCTVDDSVLCLGRRTFHKRLFCKWTKGDRWSTALALSIVLGGFGVDRFYLGHWQEAIGKFFSFGGLGVWTLIDVVLIAIGYLSPADGSLYIT